MGLVLLAEAAFLAWGWLALRRGGAAAPEAPAV
jgi:hypothetical protein